MVVADFLLDQLVGPVVEGQQALFRRLRALRARRQVDQFVRVLVGVVELQVVVGEQGVPVPGQVMAVRAEVAGELVAAVKDTPVQAAVAQLRAQPQLLEEIAHQLHRRDLVAFPGQPLGGFRVGVEQHAVGEQDAVLVAPGGLAAERRAQVHAGGVGGGFTLGGQAHQGRHQVQRRAQVVHGAPAAHVRVADDQRHPAVFLVGHRAFLPQAVGAGHFAVVGGVDDDGVVELAAVLQGLQHMVHLP